MVHDEVDTGVHPEEPTEAPTDDRLFIKWLKARPAGSQEHLAQVKFDELLLNAAQPLNASGNGCIRLCYYTEQCMSSKSPPMESVAFSSENCTAMFNFYIDCNEKTQSRSMRQVLDLVSSLIAKNPDPESVTAVRASILGRCLSIISHQAAVPLVKPAFKSLEFLIGKRTITTQQFFEAYGKQRIGSLPTSASGLRDEFFLEVFDWMMLADVAPAAGKFLVTIFKQIRSDHSNLTDDVNIVSWQRWIRAGLNKDPRALESVKNYILLPLFKVDRPGSLILLEELSNQGTVTEPKVQDLDCHSLLQLAAIEVGKKSGLIEEPNTVQFKAPKKSAATVALQEDAISGLLSNASDTVRSLAFSVMVSSSSPIRPFTAFALETLRLYLPSLYSDTDAKFRNEVLSNSKHMIDRLRGSTGFLVRELDSIDARAKRGTRDNQSHIVSHAAACLSIHKEFIEWYFKFLLEELIPTTSYQRHITALKATELLLHSGVLKHDGSQPPPQKADNDTVWPFHIDFFTPISMRLLLDLLMDPFEDVRSGATGILKLASPRDFMIKSIKTIGKDNNIHYTENMASLKGEVSKIGSIGSGESLELLQTFISRAENDSRRTGRADYADGVARSCDLLYALQRSKESRLSLLIRLVDDLETKVEIAEQGLGQAVLEAPVHGTFAALSLVWDSINRLDDFGLSTDENYAEVQLEALPQRIVDLCRRIWTAVKEILCNDSPEGHLPQDLDEVEIVDTKDLLSYSFRAIHESSNLMRTIVNKIANGSKDRPPLVSARVFAQIGDLTFDQLSSLRHRGAFSTVSLTFARCCILTQLQASAIGGLLGKWFNGALDCIFEQASTTRRSAGIPALLTGIMTANSKNPAFEDIVGKLKWIARQPAHQSATDETNLPQVHAMNSLKETFRSSILGRRAENHIGECLQISVESLKSEIWAIRNCGLLLLRSLIDCLFGTSDSKTAIEAGWDGKSIKISYDKYPALPELLVKLLSEEVSHGAQSSPDISTVESVFPALDIVRRAGPPSSHRHEIYRLVMTHLGSKVWNVREMAAHTLSVLAPQDRWAATARELLETQRASHNLRHGSLMALKFILERQSAIDANAAMGALTEIIPAFASSWDDDCTTDCPEILTAHIEARNAVGLLLASKVERSGFIPPESTRHHLSLFGPGPLDNFFNMTEPGSKFEHWHPASIALARRAVCNIFLREDYLQLAHVFKWAMGLGTDVILAALTFISGSRFAQGCQDLPGLCQAYVSTINSFDSSEVRAAALDELFGALSTGLGDKKSGVDVVFSTLLELADFLHQPRYESPSLQNAQLQMSGWLLLADIYFIGNDPNQVSDKISYWTSTLSLAGRKTEDFDTRYAAALALSSFYTSIQHLSNIPSRILLPCHLAMYDCLNDDDSEIRELAAKALSMWKSQSLIPVAAQKLLAESIIKDCHSHPLLSWNIISRMTGSLEIVLSQNHNLDSPAKMFQAALNVDNTLFVEEDQNLYIDEVREVKFWGDVLDKFLFHKKLYEKDDRHTSLDKAPISALISWTGNAIKVLNTIDQQDGILGWTSKPPAFSACMRTIICASALLKLSLGSEILEKPFFSIENGQLEVITSELATFVANASKVRLHGSLLAELNARLPTSSRHIFGTEDSDFSRTLERI